MHAILPLSHNLASVRSALKAAKTDAAVTDRRIFSLLQKHARWIINREDNKFKVFRFSPVFQPLHVPMVPIDAAETAHLVSDFGIPIQSGRIVYRSEKPLPRMYEGFAGPLIQRVATLDFLRTINPIPEGSVSAMRTQVAINKYLKSEFYWVRNGYLYSTAFYEVLMVNGFYQDDITRMNGCEPDCRIRQERGWYIPQRLHGEIESLVVKDLLQQASLPIDTNEDGKHPLNA